MLCRVWVALLLLILEVGSCAGGEQQLWTQKGVSAVQLLRTLRSKWKLFKCWWQVLTTNVLDESNCAPPLLLSTATPPNPEKLTHSPPLSKVPLVFIIWGFLGWQQEREYLVSICRYLVAAPKHCITFRHSAGEYLESVKGTILTENKTKKRWASQHPRKGHCQWKFKWKSWKSSQVENRWALIRRTRFLLEISQKFPN